MSIKTPEAPIKVALMTGSANSLKTENPILAKVAFIPFKARSVANEDPYFIHPLPPILPAATPIAPLSRKSPTFHESKLLTV